MLWSVNCVTISNRKIEETETRRGNRAVSVELRVAYNEQTDEDEDHSKLISDLTTQTGWKLDGKLMVVDCCSLEWVYSEKDRQQDGTDLR